MGGIAGAVAYTYAQPALSKTFLAQGGGKIIFSDLIGVPYWMAALALAAVIIVLLAALEVWKPWRTELGSDVDGNLPSPGAPVLPAGRAQPAE